MVAEHDAAVLSSFSAPHMDEHALGIDITPGTQRTHFGYSHVRRIGCWFDGSTLFPERISWRMAETTDLVRTWGRVFGILG